MSYIQDLLKKYPKSLFIFWSILASFGAYFSMYAFRKPFNTGVYEDLYLWGMEYKAVLIIVQVLGYTLSKFIGIKVIAELKPASRIRLIVCLILFAELALLGFGAVPYPYNFIFLFFNGLPLGMVWGIVFSFLEGRRFTEVLVFGLSISVIIASGLLKTIYLQVQEWMPFISEFWMPFAIGAIFLPLFVLFVWMLSVIPEPSEEDKRLRTERVPMNNTQKKAALKHFGTGLVCIAIIYMLLTAMRDFRDNFSVEIWDVIDPGWDKSILSVTELIVGAIVLLIIGLISLIKNNVYGFWVSASLIVVGLAGCGLSTFLYQSGVLSPFGWMLLVGICLFMAYTPIQTIFFERMLAVFRYRGNAGFFIYICDSLGYLGSVLLLLYKEFFITELNWSQVLIYFSYGASAVGMLLWVRALLFFRTRCYNRKCSVSVEETPVRASHMAE
ncbi:DUF5690 family protein [Sinomicrobium weinanense]|uniref:MFS transporter n=1 Tax=Sinomicrobium weinanense TaxID=2842200 RepID=A0A926JUW7_9FLAO|nr:DUF5690 family protein [Sinomicrobium weinanense]MBC9797759.1 hypothetical protein [Sinomicrobium weinanense]MBU3122422.1 hypothetical protein [Sinomicrobium weinanense]